MHIAYHIKVGEPLSTFEKNEVEKVIHEVFECINVTYNNWNPDSEVSLLNSLKANEKVAISEELDNFLSKIDGIASLTKGKFDPTVRPLINLWREKLNKGLAPSEEELDYLRSVVGWSKIHHEKGYFWKEDEAVSLDLCGIAKGYAVDLLIERLLNDGYRDLYVEWGGEIRSAGTHPSGRAWQIGIIGTKTTLALTDEAIATSGDYYQLWYQDEKTYTHIFNPLTLMPLEVKEHSIASATLTASSCLLADALATATMLFENEDELLEWTSDLQTLHPDIKIWILRH